MKTQLQIGQTLFRKGCQRWTDNGLKPVIVTKIGRKYFSVESVDQYKQETIHHIEDWREKTDCSPSYKLYESEQEYADLIEKLGLYDQIKKEYFDYGCWHKITLYQLREISKILSA